MPLCAEEFEVTKNSKEPQTVTLVVPRPSLVNLQEKELKPTDQDSVYICTAAVHGQVHETFESDGVRGIVMGSKETANRMVLAVADTPGVAIDLQPYFCLNRLARIGCSKTTAHFRKTRAGSPQRLSFGDQPHVHGRAEGHAKSGHRRRAGFPDAGLY